jgi:hypothetical protein
MSTTKNAARKEQKPSEEQGFICLQETGMIRIVFAFVDKKYPFCYKIVSFLVRSKPFISCDAFRSADREPREKKGGAQKPRSVVFLLFTYSRD